MVIPSCLGSRDVLTKIFRLPHRAQQLPGTRETNLRSMDKNDDIKPLQESAHLLHDYVINWWLPKQISGYITKQKCIIWRKYQANSIHSPKNVTRHIHMTFICLEKGMGKREFWKLNACMFLIIYVKAPRAKGEVVVIRLYFGTLTELPLKVTKQGFITICVVRRNRNVI